ncbi:PREDICTED: remorin [Tarenaya hassleriana]|uniref:remorin n=1 Tax=Tarenaya hassleriana TaxID=28532 RepID=UPI00053C7C26|nr:PREDICTED: remorin [Tarenaya hassleriana]
MHAYRAQKKISTITEWENHKTAKLEAKLAEIKGGGDSKKAAERLRNKIAAVHTKAQEKKAKVQTRRAEEILKAEERAAKLRATGQSPHHKSFICF